MSYLYKEMKLNLENKEIIFIFKILKKIFSYNYN